MEGPSGIPRRDSRPVRAGSLQIGGGAPIAVQSMLSVPAGDVEGNVRQAKELYAAGCDVLRVAVPDRDAVRLIPAVKEAVPIPLVADIHFDYRLALESAAAGVDKIRINPGNIGGPERVKRSPMPAGREGFRSASGSTRVPWKRRSWQNMAIPPRRPCGTAPSITFRFWNKRIFPISCSHSNLPMCRPWRPLTA